jgi:hypothetical protein
MEHVTPRVNRLAAPALLTPLGPALILPLSPCYLHIDGARHEPDMLDTSKP